MYSPLEQFEINILFILKLNHVLGFDLIVTNSTLYAFLAFGFFLFSILIVNYTLYVVPSRLQSIIELLYIFIFDLIISQAGLKGQDYFPLFFLIFGFILFSNLIGLTPYAFTPTSHIIVTFTIAFSCFLGFTILGFIRHGLGFLSFFVPTGVPVVLLPLMVVIEVMSYFIRPISLSVRLFANMLAGHTLLHIIAGFVVALMNISLLLGIIPFVLLLAITLLEFGIAFLQAYVFVILLAIYLNDSLNIAH